MQKKKLFIVKYTNPKEDQKISDICQKHNITSEFSSNFSYDSLRENCTMLEKADAVLMSLCHHNHNGSLNNELSIICGYASTQKKPIFGYTNHNPEEKRHKQSLFAEKFNTEQYYEKVAMIESQKESVEDAALYKNTTLLDLCTSIRSCFTDALTDIDNHLFKKA